MERILVPNTRVSLLSENSKLGFPSFNITPGITCPGMDKGCVNCYAMKGRYFFAAVQHAMAERLRWLQDAEARGQTEHVVDTFVRAIERLPYFRWFGSGDMYSLWMGDVIAEVARRTPRTQYYMPTRVWRKNMYVPTLRKLNALPNMVVRPSGVVGMGKRPSVDGLSMGAAVTRDPSQCNCMAQILHRTCVDSGCLKCLTVRDFTPTYLLH